MRDSIFEQNKELLASLVSQSSDIGVIIGERQNLDKIAAGLSLYLSLKSAGKNVQVISKRDPIVEYSNLVGVDKIGKNFSGTINALTIVVPNRNGEIEKVSYNTEGDKLNLNIFAVENLSFNESDIKFVKKGSSPSLIFALGVSNLEQLQGLIDFSPSVKVVNIDNDGLNSLFGDVLYTSPSFSSLSEIVAKIIDGTSLPTDLDIAQNLLDGISNITNNFMAPNTSAFAFEAAGFLIKSGAKRRTEQRRPQQIPSNPQNQPRQNYYDRPRFNDRRNVQNQPRDRQNPVAVSQPAAPVAQNVQQPVGVSQDKVEVKTADDQEIPSDWFGPKVFKGSEDQS